MEERLMACGICRKALAVKTYSKMDKCPTCGAKLIAMEPSVELWQTFSKEERDAALNIIAESTSSNQHVNIDPHRPKRMKRPDESELDLDFLSNKKDYAYIAGVIMSIVLVAVFLIGLEVSFKSFVVTLLIFSIIISVFAWRKKKVADERYEAEMRGAREERYKTERENISREASRFYQQIKDKPIVDQICKDLDAHITDSFDVDDHRVSKKGETIGYEKYRGVDWKEVWDRYGISKNYESVTFSDISYEDLKTDYEVDGLAYAIARRVLILNNLIEEGENEPSLESIVGMFDFHYNYKTLQAMFSIKSEYLPQKSQRVLKHWH